MYLRNTGPIREYLTPGVEVVAVDPNCVYNSPDSYDEEDTEYESSVTGTDSEDYIIEVDDVGPPVHHHQHHPHHQQPSHQHEDIALEETTTSVVYQPSTVDDAPTAPTTTTFAASNQTCLDHIYTDNFDLAAYITDNDFDFQTTVDNTEEIVVQHLASTLDHCSTSMPLVSATPSTSQQSFLIQPDTTATASAAAFVAEPTDTYHYVEKWLESCLQDGESSAEAISLVAGVIDASPIKLERSAPRESPNFFGSIQQQSLLQSFVDPQQSFRGASAGDAHHEPPPKRRPTPVKRAPPQVGKGRGKNISMFSMFRSAETPKEIKKEPPRKCKQMPAKKVAEPIKLDAFVEEAASTAVVAVGPSKRVSPRVEEMKATAAADEEDSDDEDDDDSLVDCYNPSHSGASSSGSSVDVVVRPKRAVVLARQTQPQPPPAAAKAAAAKTNKLSAGPSKRKFRSKSYISSSSSSSSGSESNAKITVHAPKKLIVETDSGSSSKEATKPRPSAAAAVPAVQAAQEKKPKYIVPKIAAKPDAAIPKVVVATMQTEKSRPKPTATDSVPSGGAPLKRKHSMVSSDSNDPSGFLQDLMRSRKPFVKRDKNRKSSAVAKPTVVGAVRRNVELPPKTVVAAVTPSLAGPKGDAKVGPMVRKPVQGVSLLRNSLVNVAKVKPISTVDTKMMKTAVAAARVSDESSAVDVEMVASTEEATAVADTRTPAEIQEEEQAQQKKRLNLEEYLKRRRGFKVKPMDANQLKASAKRNLSMTQHEQAERARQEKAWLLSQNLEEIVIVSMGCNTDISISNAMPEHAADTPSHLINNINDTLIKAHGENVKISSNSLIASIQDVLIKKCIPATVDESPSTVAGDSSSPTTDGPAAAATAAATKEHGEDKVIMYLPKDRRKVLTKSIECQTENLLQFPMLQRMRVYRKRTASRHSYRSRSRSRDHEDDDSDRRSSSYDSDSSDDTVMRRKRHTDRAGSSCTSYRTGNGKYYASVGGGQRSRMSSYRNSLSRSESETTESEENLRLHSGMMAPKQQTYANSRPPPKMNAEQTKIIEERRIVYVGRIETNTTKEDLRKKFMVYGPIRQITIHYKDTGMKFGFVTYDNAKDAYRAIENSTRDDTINMYDVSFGGRRAFCKSSYMDLDGSQVDHQHHGYAKPAPAAASSNDSFEELLRKMKEKLSQKRSVDQSC